MNADRKKIGIFIIAVSLVIIILIIYFGFIKKASPTVEPEITPEEIANGQLPAAEEAGTSTPSDVKVDYQVYDIESEAPHQTNSTDLGKLSMSFAERFGSFSNQSNYGNFTDLKILMTDNMKEWIDKYIIDLKNNPKNGTAYYGVTTDALTYEVKKFDNTSGQAEVTIETQRRESTEKINGGDAYLQKLDLSLVKVNGEWLFDKAYWEK